MNKEKKLNIQTLLRKIDSSTRKHMMSRENLSHMPSERDALRHARSQGRLDFLFKDKVLSTRFQTETEENYVGTIEKKAKKHLEKQQPDGMGIGEPMMEVKKDEITTIILEEMDVVLQENWRKARKEKLAKKNGCKAMKGRIFRMRRGNWKRFKKAYKLKLKQWPHSAFPAFSVKDPEGKPDGEASFIKFYDEVRKNKCAYIALGGYRKKMPANGKYPFDYKFGDQHSDAYTYLNPATRAGGKAKVDDETTGDLSKFGLKMPEPQPILRWNNKEKKFEPTGKMLPPAEVRTMQLRGREQGGMGYTVDQLKKDPNLKVDTRPGKLARDTKGERSQAGKRYFFTDPMAYQLATYEKYSRRGEQYKRKVAKYLEELQAIEANLSDIEAERRQISASSMSIAEKRAKFRPLTAKFDNYYKQGEQTKKILNMIRQGKMVKGAGKVARAAAARAKELGSKKNYSPVAMRRAELFLARKYDNIQTMAPQDLGAEIREMEDFLEKGQLPPKIAADVKGGLEIYRDAYKNYGRGYVDSSAAAKEYGGRRKIRKGVKRR